MILNYLDKTPHIDKNAYVFRNTVVIGDVSLGPESSIWFGTVVRGDVNTITIGARTNIQDNSCIHVTTATHPTHIGDNVTIGHTVTIHGSVIGDNSLIGMGSTLLDGCTVGKNVLVAAGSMVKMNTKIPDGVLVAGNPAAIKRELKPSEIEFFKTSARNYVKYSERYLTYSPESIYTYEEIFKRVTALKSHIEGDRR